MPNFCSVFSKNQVTPPDLGNVAPPPSSVKNWTPGIWISSSDSGAAQENRWYATSTNYADKGIKQRLQADTAGKYKGVLLRFTPRDLEGPTMGDFTRMNKVNTYLNEIANLQSRKIIVLIQLKSFSPTANIAPEYMTTDAAYGDAWGNGQYSYDSGNGGDGGKVLSMQVNNVRDRMKAIMQEFATRFNNNPNLEAVAFTEASISFPVGSTNWNRVPWFNNMTNAYQDMKANLTNIQIAQWINADRDDMEWWVPQIRAVGIGLGVPDCCPDDKGFNYRDDIPGFAQPPGNIQHLERAAGQCIIMAHASKPVLEGTVVGRGQFEGTIQNQPRVYPKFPGVGTSRQAVRDHAVNVLHATHLLIVHNPGNQPVTGERDPKAPLSADPYTAYGNYGGRGYNTVTNEWVQDPTSNITTVTDRPPGW